MLEKLAVAVFVVFVVVVAVVVVAVVVVVVAVAVVVVATVAATVAAAYDSTFTLLRTRSKDHKLAVYTGCKEDELVG